MQTVTNGFSFGATYGGGTYVVQATPAWVFKINTAGRFSEELREHKRVLDLSEIYTPANVQRCHRIAKRWGLSNGFIVRYRKGKVVETATSRTARMIAELEGADHGIDI